MIQLLGYVAERQTPAPGRSESLIDGLKASPGGDWLGDMWEEGVGRRAGVIEREVRRGARNKAAGRGRERVATADVYDHLDAITGRHQRTKPLNDGGASDSPGWPGSPVDLPIGPRMGGKWLPRVRRQRVATATVHEHLDALTGKHRHKARKLKSIKT